jgi:hypothetical protein
MAASIKSCFVIMPFSKTIDLHDEQYWTNHFNFLKTVIKEVDPTLPVRRSEALRGDILSQIIKDLVYSEVVVADLTDANPNVYWELGVRQSFAHGTVTIAQVGTKRPFDLSGKSTLYYFPAEHTKNEEFRSAFKEAVKDCLDHPERPDSHVLSNISGRGSVFEIIHHQELLRRIDALLGEIDTNLKTVEALTKILDKNKGKKPEDYVVPTNRLLNASGELLATERYLDEDDAFYRWIVAYDAYVLQTNEQLGAFEISREATQNWLMNELVTRKVTFSESLQTVKKMIIGARKKIIDRL